MTQDILDYLYKTLYSFKRNYYTESCSWIIGEEVLNELVNQQKVVLKNDDPNQSCELFGIPVEIDNNDICRIAIKDNVTNQIFDFVWEV